MRQYRPETYETVRDLDQTVKIEASNNIIELVPIKTEVIEYKPIPQWSSDEVQLRAESLDLSLRRSA